MKMTMLTIGSTGDVRPYILLGQELQSRGHYVTIATFSTFRELVTSAGLSFFPICGDAELLMKSIMAPDTNSLMYLPRLEKSLKATAQELIRDMTDSCRDAEAMICGFFGSIYYSIAEKYRIPCVQTHYFPMDPTADIPISAIRHQHMGRLANEASYKIGYLLIGMVERRYLTGWRKENGLSVRRPHAAPDYHVLGHRIPVVYAISPSVFPRPAEWDEHIYMSGFWMDESVTDYHPSQDLESFLSEGAPPIYIGFGSMNGGNMNRLMTCILKSLHASRLRAVISLGWSKRHFKSTKNVFFAEYVPHDWLFPRVSAVVHHGGAGTTAAGLRYGKPTLIIPFAGDQPFWGNRVYSLGCGPKPIPRESITVQKLTQRLLDLVSHPDYYRRAAEIGEKLKEERGTIIAADIIEKEIAIW